MCGGGLAREMVPGLIALLRMDDGATGVVGNVTTVGVTLTVATGETLGIAVAAARAA